MEPIADWTKLEQYPIADAPLSQWAWEFLRRNPDYRRWWYRKPRPPRTGYLLTHASSPWGLRFHPLPEFSKPLPLELVGTVWPGHEFEFAVVPSSKIAFVLDPELPTEPQLKKIREELLRAQKSEGISPEMRIPQDRALWVTYLRLFDADAAGVPRKEIAAALFSEKANGQKLAQASALKSVENGLKAARRLCKDWKRVLLAAQEAPHPIRRRLLGSAALPTL